MLLEAEVSFLFTNTYKKKKTHYDAEFTLKNVANIDVFLFLNVLLTTFTG